MQPINALVKTQHKSNISAICNYWPQLQLSGGGGGQLTLLPRPLPCATSMCLYEVEAMEFGLVWR